ncbi:MAG: hypothetical protein A2787_07545 [Omnitrophica WOR_2 bacterium RIFCSPHIGHO2_01_FULL_48_9]|nr:MAG: hypothetical protein A3D10_02865 [Omnitrophica WOR_2 bacterium RIFCSPHIGHO2_02_FULL_48_11]OGX32676.1 MAG: hypothetical protein A2787_07545 [Omnitrophica WOR_2 bacterium RIFCSPHIGHO2_01_FULL_48_9]
MTFMGDFAKILIFFGIVLIVVGGVLLLLGKIPGFGKLPGDILIKRENFTFYFPLTTSILISIIISLVLFFFNRR